jgi:hypothetical protein
MADSIKGTTMSKRHRRREITQQVPQREDGIAPGLPPHSSLPARELPDLRKRPAFGGWIKWLPISVAVGSLACALVGVLHYIDLMDQTTSLAGVPTPLPAPNQPPPWVPLTEEDQLVDRLVQLLNAKDPAVEALLGPALAVPERPLRKAEAEALQAAFFLRDDLRIVDVWRYRDLPAHQGEQGADMSYILVTKGNVAAPRLTIWKNDQETETESSQRTMSNPDIHLRVVGGKIIFLRPELHTGP